MDGGARNYVTIVSYEQTPVSTSGRGAGHVPRRERHSDWFGGVSVGLLFWGPKMHMAFITMQRQGRRPKDRETKQDEMTPAAWEVRSVSVVTSPVALGTCLPVSLPGPVPVPVAVAVAGPYILLAFPWCSFVE